MPKTAKLHPTDARDQQWISEAVYFTAFCQRGPHDRRRVQTDTQAEAEAAGLALSAEMGKAALIYAVTAAGRSAFVKSVSANAAASKAPKEGATMTTAYATKKAASAAAREALGPDARFTTDKTATGWVFAAMPESAEAAAIFDATDKPQKPKGLRAPGPMKAKASDDPALVVDGLLYPNKTRAAEARRALANRKTDDQMPEGVAAAGLQEAMGGPLATEEVAADRAKADPAPQPRAPQGKRAQIEADARNGVVPQAPDFSADTHKRYRAQLQAVVAMVEASDTKGLRAEVIKTTGSSGKALARYRDLAVIALEARG